LGSFGAKVEKVPLPVSLLSVSLPVISLPWMVTSWTPPWSTRSRNSE